MRVYWRRRRYERLEGSTRSRKKNRVQLGEKGRKRFGRIKIKPRFRWLRLVSPKKLLIKLRDGYVKMMLSFANSAALSGGYGYGYGSGFGIGEGVGAVGLGRPPLKEYDEKVIVEIYKSLVAQKQLMATKDAGVGTQINLRR